MSDAKLVEVGSCFDCPFSIAIGDWWMCEQLDGIKPMSRETYSGCAPPDWCPLRKSDHLVTLRVK